MAKSSTAKKPTAWTWQSPRGKLNTKWAWPTKADAQYAADYDAPTGSTVVPVYIVPATK